MFSWFKKQTIRTIGFEDILYALKYPHNYVIINTLPTDMQNCLINGTLRYDIEEKTINEYLNLSSTKYPIVILYGKNATDASVNNKEQQLTELGFKDIYIYNGGMFEWMLLQETYGTNEFPTTTNTLDLLKYKPTGIFQVHRIEN